MTFLSYSCSLSYFSRLVLRFTVNKKTECKYYYTELNQYMYFHEIVTKLKIKIKTIFWNYWLLFKYLNLNVNVKIKL